MLFAKRYFIFRLKTGLVAMLDLAVEIETVPGGEEAPIQVALVSPARMGCQEMSGEAPFHGELLRTFFAGKLHPQMDPLVAQ